MKKRTPRTEYNFHEMNSGDVKKILISKGQEIIATRARCAAYAYARRNGESVSTYTEESRSGKMYLYIQKQ